MKNRKAILAFVIFALAIGAVVLVGLSRTKAEKARQEKLTIELENRLEN